MREGPVWLLANLYGCVVIRHVGSVVARLVDRNVLILVGAVVLKPFGVLKLDERKKSRILLLGFIFNKVGCKIVAPNWH